MGLEDSRRKDVEFLGLCEKKYMFENFFLFPAEKRKRGKGPLFLPAKIH